LLPGITPTGVPKALTGTALPFEFNNTESLEQVLLENEGEIAAIIMEASRSFIPEPGFLESGRELATKHGCVLIFDEVVTGFRLALGGAQEYYDVTPDMSTYAKTISNGFALGAVAGKREVMECAGDMFISSVYWAEATGLAAGLASVKAMQDIDAPALVWDRGRKFMDGLESAISDTGVPCECVGLAPSPFAIFKHEDPETNDAIVTLYMQEMARRGVFAAGVNYLCVEHSDSDLQQVTDAMAETFGVIRKGLEAGDVHALLDCPVRQSGFKRLV
ncbi:MAG TPA: aminotransferase class III-fold pyridoxal phosphate-dependent enzyme, partial [Armatimonadota bacterium]|nr:aminotransferase class III-fold pyridoxal phosphate-dependent enzyme [Armatimonadota bacterium]